MIEPVYLFEPGETARSPLFILVHGRAGNVRIMSGISRSLPSGSARLFIQAPVPDPIGGFSWWLLEDPDADPWQASFALDRILVEILPQLGIEPRIAAGIGFSQGGGVLGMALQRNSRLLKGLALLASFVIRSPEPVPSGAAPDVFIAHGSDDTVVTIDEAEKGARYLTTELGWPTTMVVDSVGHKVGVQGMRGLKEWAIRMVME
jgi:phospholipase/carboxylesterase